MLRVLFGILILIAIALFVMWRKKVKRVVFAEGRLADVTIKKEELSVRQKTLRELASVSELERKIEEEENRYVK